VAAQALKGRRAGPALGTIDRVSGRARVVLFRVAPRAANRARPIWKSISATLGVEALPRVPIFGTRGSNGHSGNVHSPVVTYEYPFKSTYAV
jgi:hypothetical protein